MVAIWFADIGYPRALFVAAIAAEVDIDDMVGLRTLSFRGRRLRIDDTAQRERNRSLLARVRKFLGLLRIDLDCRGFANDDLLAFLIPDCLVYCEHSNIGKYCLADDIGAVLTPRASWFLRQHNINMVVRQNETAGVGVGRNIERFPEDFSFLMTTKEARNLKFNLESQVHNMVVPDMLSVSLLSRALQCSQAYYEGRELQLCRSRSYVHSSNSVNFC